MLSQKEEKYLNVTNSGQEKGSPTGHPICSDLDHAPEGYSNSLAVKLTKDRWWVHSPVTTTINKNGEKSYLWPTLRCCSAWRGECLGDHCRYRKRSQRVQDIYILYVGAVKLTARCTTTRMISYISGECQPQCRPVHRGQPTHTQRMVKLPKVHPRNVRPTKRSPPRAQNPDAKSRGTRDHAVRLRHEELARVPLRHAAPSPPQLPDSLHRLAV